MKRSRIDGVVWITGAGKGIGRALALALAGRGLTVAASARTEDDLRTLAAEAGPGRVVPVPLDVADEAATAAAVARIEEQIGPIGLAVLNAGTHAGVSADDFDMARIRKVLDVNVYGTAHGLAALLPVMRRRRAGRIAVVSSVAGYRGLPTAAAYSASKAALIAMCEALRPELERDDVELTLINPGFVDTPLTRRNTFPMPFLIDVDTATERILKGLEGRGFEIVFPLRMAVLMKLLRILPYGLFFAVTRRMLSRAR